MPHIFGNFRKKLFNVVKVRDEVWGPTKWGELPFPYLGAFSFLDKAHRLIPTLAEFGFSESEIIQVFQPNEKRSFEFEGSETNGTKRLTQYIKKK